MSEKTTFNSHAKRRIAAGGLDTLPAESDELFAWVSEYMSSGSYAKRLLNAEISPTGHFEHLSPEKVRFATNSLVLWAQGALSETLKCVDLLLSNPTIAPKLHAWLVNSEPMETSKISDDFLVGMLKMIDQSGSHETLASDPTDVVSGVISALSIATAPDDLVSPDTKIRLLWAVNLTAGCRLHGVTGPLTDNDQTTEKRSAAMNLASNLLQGYLDQPVLVPEAAKLPHRLQSTYRDALIISKYVDPEGLFRAPGRSLVVGSPWHSFAPAQVAIEAELGDSAAEATLRRTQLRVSPDRAQHERVLQLGRADVMAEWLNVDPAGYARAVSVGNNYFGHVPEGGAITDKKHLARAINFEALRDGPLLPGIAQLKDGQFTVDHPHSIPLLPENLKHRSDIVSMYYDTLSRSARHGKLATLLAEPGALPPEYRDILTRAARYAGGWDSTAELERVAVDDLSAREVLAATAARFKRVGPLSEDVGHILDVSLEAIYGQVTDTPEHSVTRQQEPQQFAVRATVPIEPHAPKSATGSAFDAFRYWMLGTAVASAASEAQKLLPPLQVTTTATTTPSIYSFEVTSTGNTNTVTPTTQLSYPVINEGD